MDLIQYQLVIAADGELQQTLVTDSSVQKDLTIGRRGADKAAAWTAATPLAASSCFLVCETRLQAPAALLPDWEVSRL